jgi:hypothetical protein
MQNTLYLVIIIRFHLQLISESPMNSVGMSNFPRKAACTYAGTDGVVCAGIHIRPSNVVVAM